MKRGDKVRFLHEQGGGIIKDILGGGIVVVEDEDGFAVPVHARDVVVVQSDCYDIGVATQKKSPQMTHAGKGNSLKRHDGSSYDDAEESRESLLTANEKDQADERASSAPCVEREGGDKLSAYLAFVPMDVKDFSHTRFEAYLVNDSNYYMAVNYLSCENNSWTLRATMLLEPNTKEFVEEFGHEDLAEIAHVAIQATAYKRGKPFLLKPTCDVQFRVDGVKFYKLHAFTENDFFEQPALLFTIVEEDKIAGMSVGNVWNAGMSPATIGVHKVQAAGAGQPLATGQTQAEHRQQQAMAYVRRYETTGRKGNPFVVERKTDKDAIVVDLHADQLLDTTAGMDAHDILEYQLQKFREVLRDNASRKGQRIVFIHGKGDGVLRRAIINDLNYRYKTYTFQDASFQEYGYGATQVTIR